MGAKRVGIIVRAGLFLFEMAAWIAALTTALLGDWWWAAGSTLFAVSADVVGRVWSRKSPVPLPYFMWWLLLLPRGAHSPKNLMRILEPQPGERILEVGPGVGVHALVIAEALQPDGVLHVIDVEQAMLDHLMQRAARRGLTNIVPRQGDARQLSYPERMFDAAYLIGVIGEVPDGVAALRELRRVLKPDGRLIIGELLLDPDFVSFAALQEKGNDAGFRLVGRAGTSVAYWAIFRSGGPEAASVTTSRPGDPRRA